MEYRALLQSAHPEHISGVLLDLAARFDQLQVYPKP
jgi:hypothetical protein